MIRTRATDSPKGKACPIGAIMKGMHLDKIDHSRVKLEEKEIFQGMSEKKSKKKSKKKKKPIKKKR